jgi:hypothetical protein
VAAEILLLLAGSPIGLALPLGLLAVVLVFGSPDSALTFACIGLFTISWDRVSFRTGGMTLKPAYVVFGLALVIDVLEQRRRAATEDAGPARSRARLVRRTVLGLLALLVVATAVNGFLLEGARQIFVVVFGALVPAWVCYRLGQSPARRHTLIAWALIGAGVAAAFGVYQFAARYLGLPTLFAYTGVGGNLGRTAGFSYEPAFFSMYLLSLLPLLVVLLIERRSEVDRAIRGPLRGLFLLLIVAVFVSNARAGYLVLPLAIFIPLVTRGSPQAVRARPVVLLCASLVGVVIVSVIVRFDASEFLRARIASITDTKEVASNAPRLLLYDTDRRIAADHPLLGIGPGTLGYALPRYGLPLDYPGFQAEPTRAVANNIWLQAVLDCGIGGVVGVASIMGALYWMARRSRDHRARQLAVGCLLVFLVGGSLTSIFWDAKYWVLIGLALAADASSSLRPQPPDPDGPIVGETVPARAVAGSTG